MAKLIYATNEMHMEESRACALVLYFDGNPTEEEIKWGCIVAGKQEFPCLHTGADPGSEFFSWEVDSTPVSSRAGLTRIQVFE